MPLRASLSDGATLSGNREAEEEEEAAAPAPRLLGSFFSISSSTWCSMTSLSSIVEELHGSRGRGQDHGDGASSPHCLQTAVEPADRMGRETGSSGCCFRSLAPAKIVI